MQSQLMVKQRPILFSTEMVQAILNGSKRMTRRVLKPQPVIYQTQSITGISTRYSWPYESLNLRKFHSDGMIQRISENISHQCPYGKVGDILWVRETWCKAALWDGDGEMPSLQYWYRGDDEWTKYEWQEENDDGPRDTPRWKPSIHMPYAAARLFLRITNIRVERLQDISEEDAIAEGVFRYSNGVYKCYRKNQSNKIQPGCDNSIDSFTSLWITINGKDSFMANPWIWVITFEKIEKPANNEN